MIRFILSKIKDFFASRILIMSALYAALAFILLYRMFELQIVAEDETIVASDYLKIKTRYIPSTRGLIYDRNGVLIAYNELTYAVLLEDNAALKTNTEKNKAIHELLSILKKHNYELELDFAIELDENGELVFNVSGTAEQRFKKNAYGLRSVNDLSESQKNATAEEVFAFLRYGNRASAMFQVSEDYSLEEALEIVTVRYHFFTMVDKSSRLTIASEVDDLLIAAVMEAQGEIPGISIEQRTTRVYNHGFYFAHVVGYTGTITESEVESFNKEYTDAHYELTDSVGKTGLEREMERVLAGQKGIEQITLNSSGKVVSKEIIQEPVPGQNIYLTVDLESQVAYYHILEKNIAQVLSAKIVEELDYGLNVEINDDDDEIKIPVYEVYYALFNNNVLDMSHFNSDTATTYEKNVYEVYAAKKDVIIANLYQHLSYGSTQTRNKLSEEMQTFLSYFMSQMNSLKLLPSGNVDTSDETYQAYQNNQISTAAYLTYCVNKQWVDFDELGIDDTYYSTDEIYNILLDKVFESLYNNQEFDLKIYRNLIFNNKITGNEICILLFDQNVLKYSESDYNSLKKKSTSAYKFIIQKISNLEITPAQLALAPCSGSIVQADIDTGAVTALVSYPSYDLNKLANKIEWSYYSELLADKSNPLYNRATQQRTTTGSTIKMLSAISGLSNNMVTTTEKIYDEIDFLKIFPPPSCWEEKGHGNQTISTAIQNSCNFFFYEVGYRLATDEAGKYSDSLGIAKLKETGALFGLTEVSGVELGEAAPEFSTADAVRSAIGYGYKFTPLQISRYTSTLATEGVLYQYTLVNKITDKDGEVIASLNPVIKNITTDITSKEWDSIYEGMQNVILKYSNTLKRAYSTLPITVAGKTGSAQVGANNPAHAVFVSFAPIEAPEISVITVIANGYSGNYAGLTCRDVYGYYYNGEFREYLEYINEEELTQ